MKCNNLSLTSWTLGFVGCFPTLHYTKIKKNAIVFDSATCLLLVCAGSVCVAHHVFVKELLTQLRFYVKPIPTLILPDEQLQTQIQIF